MLREEVLREWKSFKERILNGEKLLEEINNNLADIPIVLGGLEIKETPYQVMEKLRNKFPSIMDNCRKLRNKHISNQFGQVAAQVDITYLTYVGLVETHQKIMEYYDQSQSGPNIEIVD